MTNQILIGKKILFLCPSFFDYEKILKKEMELLGASVYLFDERPSNKTIDKIKLRLNKDFLEKKIRKYYMDILQQINEVIFDFIFICRAESLPEFFLKELSNKQKKSHKILYLWDSIEDNKNGFLLRKYFDKVITFDHEDARRYNLYHRPLFFDKIYEKKTENNIKYELSFVGTAHNDRYSILNKIEQQFINSNKKYYIYRYLQTPWMLPYYKYIKKDYPTSANKNEFEFVSLSLEQVQSIMDTSIAILDIQKDNQKGLTMRSIETLGSNKKLITTNDSISQYDFYNKNNILIIDRENPVIDFNFFETPYESVNKMIMDKYSIEYFIKDIFAMDTKNTFLVSNK